MHSDMDLVSCVLQVFGDLLISMCLSLLDMFHMISRYVFGTDLFLSSVLVPLVFASNGEFSN